jgi:hypothetical protein
MRWTEIDRHAGTYIGSCCADNLDKDGGQKGGEQRRKRWADSQSSSPQHSPPQQQVPSSLHGVLVVVGLACLCVCVCMCVCEERGRKGIWGVVATVVL